MGYVFSVILHDARLNITIWRDGKYLTEKNCDWNRRAVNTAVERLANKYGLDQDEVADRLQAQLPDSPPY